MNQKKKHEWRYMFQTSALADTGDYESYITFFNGDEMFQSTGDDLEEVDAQKFCDLLNLMPDLWSHKLDNAEFMLSQAEKEIKELKQQLQRINSENCPNGCEDTDIVFFRDLMIERTCGTCGCRRDTNIKI